LFALVALARIELELVARAERAGASALHRLLDAERECGLALRTLEQRARRRVVAEGAAGQKRGGESDNHCANKGLAPIHSIA